MGNLFEMKRNDRLPILNIQLQDDDGTVIDLSGCTVNLYMRNSKDVLVLSTAMDITSPATLGQVTYSWAAVDTQYSGNFKAEVEITYASTGKKLTVPTSGYIDIRIYKDLGA